MIGDSLKRASSRHFENQLLADFSRSQTDRLGKPSSAAFGCGTWSRVAWHCHCSHLPFGVTMARLRGSKTAGQVCPGACTEAYRTHAT